MITLLHEQRETQWPEATGTASTTECLAEGDALWLDAAAIEAATGWSWKPEGLCHGDTCVPLPRPRGDGAEPLVRDGRLNLAALWRHSGQPVVHDAASRTWVLGSGSARRGAALATLQAPDFTLPDLQGGEHRLSAYRGRKVFLATWASW
ncbi:MAG: redoxin domain-containing protein [Rubrivivax sp.]|nr:redoxin domain-containing protein [Rubrivivax sp.]